MIIRSVMNHCFCGKTLEELVHTIPVCCLACKRLNMVVGNFHYSGESLEYLSSKLGWERNEIEVYHLPEYGYYFLDLETYIMLKDKK